MALAISLLTLGGCSDQPEAPVELLFEGDSDVELWDTSGYPDSHNVGVGGAVCADVLDTIDATLQTYEPSVVVLVCGENDLWVQDVSDTFDDVSAVVERIQESGAKTYYMGTKPEPSTTSLHDDYRAYDARVSDHATSLAVDGDTPLVMVDVYRGFQAEGNPDRLYQSDELHLSEDGYALWNSWLTRALDDDTCIMWESGECVHTGTP